MLSFTALRELTAVKKANRFITSVFYIFFICLLALLANMLAAEAVIYTVYTLLWVYICLLGDDLLGLMPIVICCYLVPSAGNNPGSNGQSVFSLSGGGIYILCLGAIMVLAVLLRLLLDRPEGSKKPALLSGMILLALGYCLSGIASPAYPETALKNIFFALLQAAAVIVPYLVFTYGVRWESARRDYFAWIGFEAGCLLFFQILWTYFSAGVIVDGVIVRQHIFTGWGMYNNMGAMLAMMIPFAFYLAAKYHKGWIGSEAGSAYLLGVLLTCSRSSILMGSAAWLLCIVMMLRTARNRKSNSLALVITVTVVVLSVLLFRKQLLHLFGEFLSLGTDPSTRDTIYLEGLKQFVRYPVFGGSFYPIDFVPWDWSSLDTFSSFFPPRWHNTAVQLLASCGIVGTAGYLIHRFQTVRLFIRGFHREKAFIGCAVLVLLGTSLLDCHFFNIGPTLFYSMSLAFAENRK